MIIRKAERRKAKLRLGLAGPSGSGKTMSALRLAKGLGGRACMIDTERGSGDLYGGMYDYDIITLTPPYAPKVYIEAIKAAEEAGYDVIITDSLSHAWSDEGGLLDQADKLTASGKVNNFTVWRELTPQHRALVNAILNSPAHFIATVRSKQQYELEEYTDSRGNKKKQPVKVGLAPVFREGIEYEFSIFFDINQDHFARATKDRTNMFANEVFVIDEKVGERIMGWLNSGKDDPLTQKQEIVKLLKALGIEPKSRDEYEVKIKELTGYDLVESQYGSIITKLTPNNHAGKSKESMETSARFKPDGTRVQKVK